MVKITDSQSEDTGFVSRSRKVLGLIPGMTCGSLHVLPVPLGFPPGTPVSSHMNETCSMNEYECD